MRYAGLGRFGKTSAWLAGLFLPPYLGRIPLSRMSPKGYLSPRAMVAHPLLRLGKHVFVDDDVLIYQDAKGGFVELGDGVQLLRGNILQTGRGGAIRIGPRTHVQPCCQFSAYLSSIVIGERVEIAPGCAFYPYNHGMEAGTPIRLQPLQSKGGIVIEDDAWLSVGVKVLDGVRIGRGAVVGAGAVVTTDLPANSISSGVPARVLKMRSGSPSNADVDKGKEKPANER
jgi:acetyltransferase-like isoleucine patch superfamily enzyme